MKTIPIADERVGVQVKLWNPLRTRACALSALQWWSTTKRRYIKYGPLPLPLSIVVSFIV